jgi:starch phosphorylase
VRGFSGSVIPVYLLDTDLPENAAEDRDLTGYLYAGDSRYRLRQEALLGLGGLQVLEAVGHSEIDIYHMNEGHSSLLTLGLLKRQLHARKAAIPTDLDIEAVRSHCVFTTHTPVPAGHDQFDCDLARRVLGGADLDLLAACAVLNGHVNMTYVALRFSHYINGVAMHHGEVSQGMFPNYPVHAITNGVHAPTWTSPAFQELYDRHIPEWRRDNLYLRYVIGIEEKEIMETHQRSKRTLLEQVRARSGVSLDEKAFTIGFARRATQYKRPDLLFSNIERLKWIAKNVGAIQILYAGGKEAIRKIFEAAAALRGTIPVVYLENYNLDWARLLTSGSDLWLNTPLRPQEASGTSGMKAALNGVPSLSILDGWWIEGWIEGVTGWAIGGAKLPLDDAKDEIASLYSKLETVILPMYYGHPESFGAVMRSAITFNGSFFNTQRMVEQYLANAYADDRRPNIASA